MGSGAPLSAIASTITVNTYSDTVGNGRCSLREAITAANTNTASGSMPGECAAGTTALDTIVFNVFGEFCMISGCAISPLTPLPDISSDMSIVGPGSGSLAVQPGGGAKIRIFNVSTGSPTTPTSISGLTIRNGDILDVDGGGGVRNAAPVLNLTDCVFRNNKVTGTTNSRQGGGLLNAGGTVNVSNCTFTQNTATRGGGV